MHESAHVRGASRKLEARWRHVDTIGLRPALKTSVQFWWSGRNSHFPSKAQGKPGVAGPPTLHGAYLTSQHVQPPDDDVVR
jgi:hypothetical protein